MSESESHRQRAEEWLTVAEDAHRSQDYGDPFPYEYMQTAALMAIAHVLLTPEAGGEVSAEDRKAEQAAAQAVESARRDAVGYVAQQGAVPLAELIAELRASGAREEYLSRAVAGLLTSGALALTPDRQVAVPS